MALIACAECGHEVSDKATACPKCGRPMRRRSVGAIRIVLGIVLCFLSACNAVSMFTDPTENMRVGAGVFALLFLVLGVLAFVGRRK